jgi:hypothetical protein
MARLQASPSALSRALARIGRRPVASADRFWRAKSSTGVPGRRVTISRTIRILLTTRL